MERIYRFLTDSRAAALPFAGVCLFMLLTVIGLVYDLGHLYVVKQELQNAADAGASAGAEAMYVLTEGHNPVPGNTLCDTARSVARDTVKLNKSDGKLLDIPPADAQVGVWGKDATGKYSFTPAPCSNSINALHVITRRTQAVNGPVPTLFARILGRDFTEVTANATAFLGWVNSLKYGCGFPIALGDKYIPGSGEKMFVKFSPANADSGTWHTFKDPSASANDLKQLVNHTKLGDAITIGDLIYLNNGWDTSVTQEMRQILSNHQAANTPWIVILPVVNGSAQYNQSTPVLGFCAFEVTAVGPPGNKYIEGYACGGFVSPSGDDVTVIPGSESALKSSIPKMVY